LEFSVYPEDGGFNVCKPDAMVDQMDITAEEAMLRWKTACRFTHPAPFVGESDPGPFCGLEPGTWLWGMGSGEKSW